MLRRCAATLLVLGMVVGATGCSQAASRPDDSPPKVGFVVQNTKFNYAIEMADGFRSGVSQVGGVQEVVVGPEVVDGPAQVAMFDDLAKSPIDGISVFTAFADLFAAPMAAANKKGIPVMTVDSRPPPGSDVKLYIGNDNRQLGQLLADQVIDKLPPNATGKIVLGITTPGTPSLDQRADGAREQIRKRLPGVKVVGPFDTKRDPAINLGVWTSLVKSNPTALAFLGTGNVDAVNLAAVRRSTKGTWQAGAFDLEPAALKGVKDGHIVLVSPEHFLKGAIAGRVLARKAKDGDALPQGWLYIAGLAVNRSNIDAIMARQASLQAKTAYFEPLIQTALTDPAALRPLE